VGNRSSGLSAAIRRTTATASGGTPVISSHAFETLRESARSVFAAYVWLFLAAAFSISLGTYDEQLLRLVAYFLVAILILATVARRGATPDPRAIWTGSAGILLWFVGTSLVDHHLFSLAILPCAVMGEAWLARGLQVPHKDPTGIVRTLVLFTLLYLAWLTVPPFWHATIAVSRSLSHWLIGNALHENVTLGPSTSGLWIFLLVICHVAMEACATRCWLRPMLAFLAGSAAWLGFILLMTRQWFARQDGAGIAAGQVLGFLLIALPAVAICGRKAALPVLVGPRRLRWVHAFILAGVLASSTLLTRSLDFGKERGKRILVYGKGYIDWKVPHFGDYGPFSGGMFGLMPKYLALDGYQVSTFEDEVISAQSLAGHDILVLINLGKEQGKEWKKEEIETIWGYVEKGGSLLILGDHTNVFGLQDCFNELLARVNIRFEFDSAYPCREGWQNCIASRPHPLTSNLPGYRGLGIAIGASLTIHPPAFPVVVGRYSFSDEGFKENVMGSYLGNYAYDIDSLASFVLQRQARHPRQPPEGHGGVGEAPQNERQGVHFPRRRLLERCPDFGLDRVAGLALGEDPPSLGPSRLRTVLRTVPSGSVDNIESSLLEYLR